MYVYICMYYTCALWELVSEALRLSWEQARGCGRPPRRLVPRRARQAAEEQEEEEEERRLRRRSGRGVVVVKVG